MFETNPRRPRASPSCSKTIVGGAAMASAGNKAEEGPAQGYGNEVLVRSAASRTHINSGPAVASAGCKADERVLSHGGVVLVRSDLGILRRPRFINDRIIAFYFAHLSSYFAAGGDDDDLLLLPASITYLLINLPEPAAVAAVAEPLRLGSRRLTLLPINDNPTVDLPDGGSHWSIMVLDHTDLASGPRFVHHDSVRGEPNLPVAERLAEALSPLIVDGPGKVVPLVEGATPRQPNGYDGGVYVMAIARAICGWWRENGGRRCRLNWLEAVKGEVDASSVKALRTELLLLINFLIEENTKTEPNLF
ncbi:hypothetical protein HU200_020514 [Digitaria exilis]|uniref:Ubiquitin-like protease family profile domain-containing protein n=1 Tax=Digitaria exilis TaxID=1010633 RepID=A0A835F1Y0_9POAL|nr:hypothetical protein HU200_020514 [Digitaria exilis]CAB3463999.1 unnamed protein product [Digitaria exilis]